LPRAVESQADRRGPRLGGPCPRREPRRDLHGLSPVLQAAVCTSAGPEGRPTVVRVEHCVVRCVWEKKKPVLALYREEGRAGAGTAVNPHRSGWPSLEGAGGLLIVITRPWSRRGGGRSPGPNPRKAEQAVAPERPSRGRGRKPVAGPPLGAPFVWVLPYGPGWAGRDRPGRGRAGEEAGRIMWRRGWSGAETPRQPAEEEKNPAITPPAIRAGSPGPPRRVRFRKWCRVTFRSCTMAPL